MIHGRMKRAHVDADRNTLEKRDGKTKWKKTRVHPLSVNVSRGNVFNAVVGFIESDKYTVCGGVITSCERFHNHCVFRTSSKHLFAMVDSEHCKWCKRASLTQVPDTNCQEAWTIAYLQRTFQLSLGDAVKLSELISELIRTQGLHGSIRSFPFSGTPPYCTVENVTHISSVALQKLLELDEDFVWGDNLIFNAKNEASDSG